MNVTESREAWWSHAVFYQVYPRSFRDGSGDGVGDLDGVVGHLDHLSKLGVDAIWLNPVTVSPMADHGYDVADPRDVDPLFGGIGALDRLVEAAHAVGIKVTMDLVPNHTSSQHPWFLAALAAGPGTEQRERYIFRDGTGPGGIHPPNNWVSIFGGPAWTRVVEPDGNPGQYYMHLFDPEQPDLNWDNPEVFDDLEKTLRFWLERGVDGFRIDVAHGMAKPPGLPDMAVAESALLRNSDDDPRFNNDGVHDIHRGIRSVLNEYPDAVTIGEIWVFDNDEFAKYLRPDELHLGFNFRLVRAGFDAAEVREAIENSLAAAELAGSPATWTLSN
ncbi:MAG: alpha-amylase family glycosyl hydrolase, partial [Myxococcota bacterium]